MLADYQRRHRYRFAFGAETSANVATQPDLLTLLRAANFEWVFIGIETPSREALLETLKVQNTRADLLTSLRTVYAHGIDVYGSFVVGFDADDATVFARQHAFIIESGIIVASIAMLLALPRTPLFERLQRDGRLQSAGESHHLWNNLIATNIIPQNMTYGELVLGFRDLIRQITSDASISQRIRNKLPHLGGAPVPFRVGLGATVAYLGRFLVHGVLRGGVGRWYHVARSLLPALLRPRLIPFVILNWVQGLAIQAFVREHLRQHGNLPVREVAAVKKSHDQLLVIER